jgi:hypothetical protein
LNITFACGCPVSNILCISLVSNDVEPGIDYHVPLGQGVPHKSGPIQLSFDTMIPWETDIIKGIVHAHPNIQPMIAYDYWNKKCSNHVDNISRCPSVNVSLSSGPVPKRTLRSISIIFPLFLGFFCYYRKRHHLLEHDLSAPHTSLAFLLAFQIQHSFWNHLRRIEKLHQYQPMPLDHFLSIDHLGAHLHISTTTIFTIPVESSDLLELDLLPAQRTKAFGSILCFGLPFVDPLSLFEVGPCTQESAI